MMVFFFFNSFYVHNITETVLFMSTPDLPSVKYNQYLPPWKKDQMETNNGDISEIVLCWWVLRTGPRLSDSRTLSRIERCPIDCDRSLAGGRTYTGVTLSVLPPRQTTGKYHKHNGIINNFTSDKRKPISIDIIKFNFTQGRDFFKVILPTH